MKKVRLISRYLCRLAVILVIWQVSSALGAQPTGIELKPKGAISKSPNDFILRPHRSNPHPHANTPGGIGQDPAATATGFATQPSLLYTLSQSSGINQGLDAIPTTGGDATALLFYADPTLVRPILPYTNFPFSPEPVSSDASLPTNALRIAGDVATPSGHGAELCPRLRASLSGNSEYWNRVPGRFQPSQPQTSPAVAQTAPIFGGAAQIAAIGPVSKWCQQTATPFYDSSPLANRVFWVPLLILAVGAAVLLGTRTGLSSSEREA